MDYNLALAGTKTKANLQKSATTIASYIVYENNIYGPLIVNYHYNLCIKNIVQILLKNNGSIGQTQHIYSLKTPASLYEGMLNNTVANINALQAAAIPTIVSQLRVKFPDTIITLDSSNQYITFNWT
jgi:hypothetical protein